MGKIIAFSNQKGGVGKTTTALNMASYLAAFGKQVLLVDIDPQGNASSGTGVKLKSSMSTYDVLVKNCKPHAAIVATQLKGLHVMPSSISLAGAEVELVYMPTRDKVLKEALNEVKNDYDYVLVDCPPSLGLLTLNALSAADSVIIPIQSEYFALEGLTQLMNTIKLIKQHLNPKLAIDGVVLTMQDKRSLLSRDVTEEIHKYFGKKVFNTIIPRNIKLAEAPSHGLPIILYDPKCKGAIAYQQLTKEFLDSEA